MLHLILGTAGTGKTTLLHERIQACVEGGGKAILLVPEQASFESEKALCRRLGAKNALSVEVLSFTRLCDRAFRALGGLSGVHMDDTAKYLLMSVALGELSGSLTAYQKSSGGAAFVSAMCETIGELKTAGCTPERLREAAGESADKALADKLLDIALIFDAYQAVVERGYSDPDDSLARACALLSECDFFGGYDIFIDGFMAFMGAEWRLIGKILAQSGRVHVALTCEGLADAEGLGVFAAAAKTARRFVETARENGSRVAVPTKLTEARRFQNPTLAAVAADFPNLHHTPCDFETAGVALVRCDDVYDELETVAAEIAALVREEGYRYREIAVIGRGLESYLVPLQMVFARYDIPFFTDLRADIQVYPLVSAILCALDAARSNYDSESVLALAKKCTTGVDPLDAALLENYCFTWDISGAAWTVPFTNNPDGMVEGFTEGQTERLTRINAARERLVAPLIRLKKSLVGCDGQGFAAAIFAYLEESGAAQGLQESVSERDGKRFLETGAQVWDILIGLLDVFGGALAGVTLPTARLIDLFRLSVATADVGSLPQTLDQVIVGTADRIRPSEPRAVFVIGLNEGKFPLWSVAGGIFSAAERERLGKQGIDLLRTPEQAALFEKQYVYFALTQASERLYLSYPQKDVGGVGLSPSWVLAQVAEITGGQERGSREAGTLSRVCNAETALDQAARGWREETPEQAALRILLERESPATMRELTQAAGTRNFGLHEGTSRALFGDETRVSPSRVERYYTCPFAYFCQVGLKLYRRQKAEFNPIESGSLIHLALEKLVRKYGGKRLATVPDEVLRAEITEIIERDLAAKIPDLAGMPARFKYLFRRLINTLMRLVKRLAFEFAQSEFEPMAFELPIRSDAEIKPLELYAADGTRVIVEGVVDRVDVLHKDGVDYVRVVDYKSGRKAFALSDVYHGLNMQMLIYLFSICDTPAQNGTKPLPAGVLYMPARDTVIAAERGASVETVRDERLKKLRMNGLLLENRAVLSAMEPDLAGVLIPVKTKKDGSFTAQSALATLAQLGMIKTRVETLLCEIADALHGGKIEAEPVDGAEGYSPCAWCDYHAVCAHEDGDAVRTIASLDRAAALALMKGDEEDG